MSPRENTRSDASGASPDSQVRSSVSVPPEYVMGLLGSADENLRALERLLAADIHARGNVITCLLYTSPSPRDS